MKKTNIIIAVVVLAIAGAGFVWWQFGVVKKSNIWKSDIVMRVPTTNWPGQYWVTIADKKGWFKEAGLNVTTVDVNSNYIQSLQDTVDGKFDTNSFTLFDLMKYNSKGAGLVLVIDSDISSGGDALVARKEINSIADLKGKTIGVAKGYYQEYILNVILTKAGVPLDSVTLADVQDEKSPDAFASGSFDAVETYEPYVSEIVKNGGHIVWDSSEIPGLMPSGMPFRKSFIDAHPEEVAAFVGVWNKTTNYIKSNPDDAFDIVAAAHHTTRADIAAFAQTDKILDLSDNRTAFSYAAGFDSLHGAARAINTYFKSTGVIVEDLDSTTFIDSRFIRALSK
jgi:NitT/TauT family transport system substrate-binding protein